jgi:hypothetical protein
MFLQHQMNALAVADVLWRQQQSLASCSSAQTSLVAQRLADYRHLQDKTNKTKVSSSLQNFIKNASRETCEQHNSWGHFTANLEDGVSNNILLRTVEELEFKKFLTHKLIALKLAEILRVLYLANVNRNQTENMSNIEVKTPSSQEATSRFIQAVCSHSTQLCETHLLRINLSALRLKDHVITNILGELGAYITCEGPPFMHSALAKTR